MVWRFNRSFNQSHGPRTRHNLWGDTYYIGRRRSNALGVTHGSATSTYRPFRGSAIHTLGQRRIIYRAMRRAGRQGIRRAAGDIRMARLVRRQAIDGLFGGTNRDVANIVESFIPSNQVMQRATAEVTQVAQPASLAAIVRTIL